MKNRIWSWKDAYLKRDYLGPKSNKESRTRRNSSEAQPDDYAEGQSGFQSRRFWRGSDVTRRSSSFSSVGDRFDAADFPESGTAQSLFGSGENFQKLRTGMNLFTARRSSGDTMRKTGQTSGWNQKHVHVETPKNVNPSQSMPSSVSRVRQKPAAKRGPSMQDLLASSMSVERMADEVLDFAEVLGIDPVAEPQLMDIAEDFYSCPMPEGWTEHWTEEDLVYYAVKARKHTQWEHPMEHFYKALVFLHRSGFQSIVEEQIRHPPTGDEIAEMADYLGVDLKEEAEMAELVKMAVGAPLPPDWHEDDSGSTYIHENGKVSNNHPLDVYFLETIRTRREEKERVLREGREAIEKAQRDVLKQIMQAKGNHRLILGIGPSAGRKEIRARYRELALVVHPDKNPQPGAADAFQQVSTAFKELMKEDSAIRSFRSR